MMNRLFYPVLGLESTYQDRLSQPCTNHYNEFCRVQAIEHVPDFECLRY